MDHRPIFIDINLVHYPIPAWASLFHRLSGVLLFFLIPFLLWILQVSLYSEASFLELKHYFTSPLGVFLLWFSLSALGFHSFAGIRHLLMDMHIGESKRAGEISSMMVFIISIVWMLVVAIGIKQF